MFLPGVFSFVGAWDRNIPAVAQQPARQLAGVTFFRSACCPTHQSKPDSRVDRRWERGRVLRKFRKANVLCSFSLPVRSPLPKDDGTNRFNVFQCCSTLPSVRRSPHDPHTRVSSGLLDWLNLHVAATKRPAPRLRKSEVLFTLPLPARIRSVIAAPRRRLSVGIDAVPDKHRSASGPESSVKRSQRP